MELFSFANGIFLLFLLAISIVDIRRQIIYDEWLVVMGALGLAMSALHFGTGAVNALWGGAAGFLLFYIIRKVSRGGMGGGDVKLALVLGLWLGVENLLVSLYIAFLAGAAVGIVIYFIRGTRIIPFAPFMALGAELALFI